MAEPFSTNELFLRSDRIAFGKIPPEVIERTEQTLILPDVTGSKLYFGLSSLVSTSGLTGTLEAIYPNYASFTFDNLNSRLGINVSTPQYSIDISTTTGVRIQGGSLIANATGLVSVPTASLFSTLPSYVFAPGTIPVTAIVSTGGSVLPGISVPTSALFSTLPTSLFAPSSIPLVALQSSGIIVASSFVGSGFYLSNIPLANINGTITGDFFRPNSIPLSTLASTGQIWIRNPEGSIFVPYLSTAQLLTSSLVARDVSTVNLTTNRFLASSIQANYFESAVFAASNLSAINIKASSLQVLYMVSTGRFFGDGQNITNLTPAYLNNVIPSDKFGYRLIAIDAINPYGDWQWIAGTFTLQQAAPIVSLGDIQASSFTGGVFRGDGRGLYNLNSISTASLVSTVRGLGTVGYVSSQSLTSSLVGLGSINYVSTASLVSTVIGLSHSGYVSSTQVISTIEGLGTLGYVSSTQLASTVRDLATAGYISSTQLNSTVTGLASIGFVSSTQLRSTVEGLASANYISSTQLNSTLQGLSQIGYVSTSQLTSTVFSLETQNYSTSAGNTGELISSLTGLASLGYISTTQLNSTLTGLASLGYISSSQLASTVFSLETQNYSTSAGNTEELRSSLTGLASLGYISTTQLNSTLTGLATLGYVSTTQLTSTVISLQNQNNSTSAGNTGELLSSLTGLGSLGYISSAQLISTVGGLEFYISSFIDPTELASTITSTVIGIGLESNLKSTVTGLGSAGYVSSLSLVSTTSALQTSSLQSFLSTVQGLGSAGYVSTPTLISTIDAEIFVLIKNLGTYGYISTSQLTSTTQGLQEYISSFIDPTELASSITSTVVGLGLGDKFTSTVTGLGSAGYISSLSLVSSLEGLGTAGYVSSLSLVSSLEGLGTAGYVSSLSLVSTTFGLQQYISTFIDPTELASTVLSTVAGIGLQSNLTSTVAGLGSAGYVSTSFLDVAFSTFSTAMGPGVSPLVFASTIDGLGTIGYVSSLSLASTTFGLQQYISTFIDPTELASTILSTVVGIGLQSNLTSTVTGLGSAGYVSTVSLVSTTIGITTSYGSGLSSLSSFITSLPGYQGQLLYMNQTTTVAPYKQLTPYENISSLQSTVTSLPGNTDSNLLAAFQSDFPLPAFLPNGIWDMNLFADADATGPLTFFYTLNTRAADTTEISLFRSANVTINSTGIQQYTNSMPVSYTPLPEASTIVVKLFGSNSSGTAQTITCYFQDNYYSHIHTTFNSAQESGASGVSSLSTVVGENYTYLLSQFLSTNNNLVSTVEGLGSAGYVSTLSMNSSIQAAISSLSTAYGVVGAGGLANIPSTLSTFAILTSSLTTSTLTVTQTGLVQSLRVGTQSTVNALAYNGLFSNYNNTVLAEISTGGGTQELLVFKGSSASDRVRVQTTGNFVVETGVSARLWSTNTLNTLSNVTPAFIINTSSNVGIQTANPGATLDVAGTGRFLTVSTQQVLTSSIFSRNALASSITTSTLQTILTTTSSITVSTIILRDQTPTCNAGNIYQRNSFLYFNNLFIFAGTRQAYGQVLQVGIGVALGGNITYYTSGLNTYQVNTFTTSGTYSVSGGSLYADIFVLGGGGGGGGSYGGGGGGGGFIYAPNVFLTSGSYTVTIGQGGTGSLTNGTNGSNSVFTDGALITYTGIGGGTGGSYAGSFLGSNGGCGGGGAGNPSSAGGSASQGYAGGTGGGGAGGAGGGGMGQAGTSSGGGANGGNGSTITITGSAIVYGGGGGGGNTGATTFGGTGGGGNGAINRTAGTNGLGGGGGGGGFTGATPLPGLNGGSGIVILRTPPG